MNIGAVLSATLLVLAAFFIGGLAIQGPLEAAAVSASGLERVILLPLELWAGLAHLAADGLAQ